MSSDTHKGQVAEIRRLVELLGGRCWTLHQVGRLRGSAGLPDMCAVVRGRAFWIEVKVGRDKLRPAQAEFKAAWDAAGVPVVVGRASDVADWLETALGLPLGPRTLRPSPAMRGFTPSGACARSGDSGAISGNGGGGNA